MSLIVKTSILSLPLFAVEPRSSLLDNNVDSNAPLKLICGARLVLALVECLGESAAEAPTNDDNKASPDPQ